MVLSDSAQIHGGLGMYSVGDLRPRCAGAFCADSKTFLVDHPPAGVPDVFCSWRSWSIVDKPPSLTVSAVQARASARITRNLRLFSKPGAGPSRKIGLRCRAGAAPSGTEDCADPAMQRFFVPFGSI